MRSLAFSSPKPVSQTVLHVRFDAAGNVVAVDRMGLEQVAQTSPSGDKTPTLGRHRSLFDELFGHIGAVGAGGLGGYRKSVVSGKSVSVRVVLGWRLYIKKKTN